MMADKQLSVIIPTHNRPASLRAALDSLAGQSLAPALFEVIVVDDGAGDGAAVAAGRRGPLTTVAVRRPGQGATRARNLGGRLSQGELLVFLDDDITLDAGTLEALAVSCLAAPRRVVLGRLRLPDGKPDPSNAYALPSPRDGQGSAGPLHFAACKSGLLAVRRADFFALGLFQDPSGGWPNWDDVDFGYRASRAGYQLWLEPRAGAVHHDAAISDLPGARRRWYQASKAAVRLFQRYPELRAELPMFADKLPLSLGEDGPALLARKVARGLASSRPALWGLERGATLLERRGAAPGLVRRLQRLLIGGAIFRGYRQGLRDFGPVTGRAWARGVDERPD
jgi:glycosyltransferase involved in cell wall biosynthesis